MPLNPKIQKVLVIGSGPIVIGQAAEFDYAGAQACRVLKAEGKDVVLVNSNPATIMTDKAMADEIYLEPLTLETVKRIIRKERPDSLLAGLGGQTGLTLAMKLHKEGFLSAHGVRLIGTNAEAIDKAEDRKLFKDAMAAINKPTIPSGIANDEEAARRVAEEIGYPVIIRPAFTLGGAGGGVARDEAELRTIAKNGLLLSPIRQILVEKYIFGWKEIEFEVMRDADDNAIAICSMENVDAVGVHTGDSIVVAPAVSLSSLELSMLKNAALEIIGELKIEGGCNCQFALNPDTLEYAVIEVNPRVSRSSALASKATGFPIAKVTTKIALGYTLPEILNEITGVTSACFEPAVDYVVLKFPKWPFDKFIHANRRLGTQMKATGEVMSIAPTFEMALMKAVRGAEIQKDTLRTPEFDGIDIVKRLNEVDDLRIFAVYEALLRGVPAEEIYAITKIDPWFLYKIKNLADYEREIEGRPLSGADYLRGKRLGFTDKALERISSNPLPLRHGAVYKMVDTCAAVYPAKTPYFYSTHDDMCESRALERGPRERIVVLGSGPIRIGQGIEFDYSSVHCVWTLKALGYEVAIINNNPETVSTDFDTADRLYFEPLTPEDVFNVLAVEQPVAVVVAFGGQTAIKLAKALSERGVKILGTSAEGIDIAEDRERFDALLERFAIKRPKGETVSTKAEALRAAEALGYPVLLRPSYVIGGQNMTIAKCAADAAAYMDVILANGIDSPVLIDKYMMGKELEVDVISDGEDVLIPGIMEHIERAGVHSGDSIAIYPPATIGDRFLTQIVECSEKLALALGTRGLVNIQYLISGGELYVIEVNPRASRTIPYISKVSGVPMIELAAKVMTGHPLSSLGYGAGLYKIPPYVAVKVPVFSFEKLSDVNSALGPEMKSTGEVLGVGRTFEEALYKGLVAAGYRIKDPRKDGPPGVLLSVSREDRLELLPLIKKLKDLGAAIYATDGTARDIRAMEAEVIVVGKLAEDLSVFELIEQGFIDYIIFTGAGDAGTVNDYIRLHRHALLSGVACLTSLDTAGALADMLLSRFNQQNTELVDLMHMRTERKPLKFSKMQGTSNDYIFFDNLNGEITSPESLAVTFCDRHLGIGGDGIVLIEKSAVADARMRIFNQDGSEGKMAGNSIRCVGKYLYDNGIVNKERMEIETASGIRRLSLYTLDGKVSAVCVHMGAPLLSPGEIPVALTGEKVVARPVVIGGERYRITCVSMGNPHCVVFLDGIDDLELKKIGPLFENDPLFPERVNTEFVRVINKNTLRMVVWERGNGETLACGTGACAAVVAAVENGYCRRGEDVVVKLPGGDLIVGFDGDEVTLTGNADLIYDGVVAY